MTEVVPSGSPGQFRTPKKAFRGLKPDAAAELIAASADVALVINKSGIIEDIAANPDVMSIAYANELHGKAWVETVASESVGKVETALKRATELGQTGWQEINHHLAKLGETAISYLTVALPSEKRFLALGRSLSETVSLQRRLVQAQQEMEREYSRVRQAETRYRLLFQFSSEPIIIADAQSMRVRELNPAAQTLIRTEATRIEGKPLTSAFASDQNGDLSLLFATARAAGVADHRALKLARSDETVDATATLFSFGRANHLLIKLRATDEAN
ncbi:MAG: PAS domain-containing protein, partial [Pseudomonadota bacterium]